MKGIGVQGAGTHSVMQPITAGRKPIAIGSIGSEPSNMALEPSQCTHTATLKQHKATTIHACSSCWACFGFGKTEERSLTLSSSPSSLLLYIRC